MPRQRAGVERVRPAGEDAQVVTVQGLEGAYRRRPCAPRPGADPRSDAGKGCPWVVANAGRWPAEAFEHSAETAYDGALVTFGCHQSPDGLPLTCAGFLLRGAEHNLAVRVRTRLGEMDPGLVSDGGSELFESYRQMAVANGVDPDHERLRPCRDPGYDVDPDGPGELVLRVLREAADAGLLVGSWMPPAAAGAA